MSSVRAFLAIPLPRPLQDDLRSLQVQLREQFCDVRWSRPENLHLTLHFFDAIEQECLEKIKVSVLSVKRSHRPFQVDIKGLGAFPGWHRPRVLWLGVEPQDQLRQLHREFQGLLREAGIATDPRPYSPHLTIGRMPHRAKAMAEPGERLKEQLVGPLVVDRLILYESRLHKGGAEHIPLMTAPLGEEEAHIS